MPPSLVAVIGGGAWGTALAQAAAAAGRDVTLWMRDPDLAREVEESRCNGRYLPDVRLEARIRATASADELRGTDAVLLVVPAQAVRRAVQDLLPDLASNAPLVICAKGIERGSDRFLSDV